MASETESQVTKFPRLATIAEENTSIAQELCILADRIDDGDFGNNVAAIVVLDSDWGTLRHSIGGPGLNKVYVAGLLTYALAKLTNPDE
jgi:hypothetical protein